MVSPQSYFSEIPTITYEGPSSANPLAFRYYDAQRKLGDKTLLEHFKFACAYWHSFCNGGGGSVWPCNESLPLGCRC